MRHKLAGIVLNPDLSLVYAITFSRICTSHRNQEGLTAHSYISAG